MAAKALQRLQKLAEGNGLLPADIHLYQSEESIFAIEGLMVLSPLFETQSVRHPGGASREASRVLPTQGELKNEVDKRRRDFEAKHGWISEAMAQLKDQAGSGWGLDDVRISLPRESTILACSENCPSCQGSKYLTCNQCGGNGSIVCPQCGGARQEMCHICNGTGQNPSMPGQPCINCNGMRYAPCRYCHGNGQLTCPSCRGSRGTMCSTCRGAGIFTEEVGISCGARTRFTINSQGLPTGLRRGLDRLGMANLTKGHADIEVLPTPEDPDDSPAEPQPGGVPGARKEKAPKPEIHFLAHLPYADLRMGFAGKKTVVGVFGKKEVLLGVPAFLDAALQPARDALRRAAKDSGKLDDALKMRLMQDTLKLHINSQGTMTNLRRLYPQGLSPQTAQEIVRGMRLAMNRVTLSVRTLASVASGLTGTGLFAALFLTPAHDALTGTLPPFAGLGLDVVALALVMGACWFSLSFATRFALQRRFPTMAIPVAQKTGKTGLTMLAGVAAGFALVLMLAPIKPAWLLLLLGAAGI